MSWSIVAAFHHNHLFLAQGSHSLKSFFSFHRQLHVRGSCTNIDDARNARRFGERGRGRDRGIGVGAYAVGGVARMFGETVEQDGTVVWTGGPRSYQGVLHVLVKQCDVNSRWCGFS